MTELAATEPGWLDLSGRGDLPSQRPDTAERGYYLGAFLFGELGCIEVAVTCPRNECPCAKDFPVPRIHCYFVDVRNLGDPWKSQ